MKLVNAGAILVIAVCAVVAVFVLKSPEPAPPPTHLDEARKLAAEVLAYQPGSNDAPKTSHPSPIDTLATARVGDWRASRVVNENTLFRDAQITSITAHAIHVVSAITDATVAIAVRGIVDDHPEIHDPPANDEVPRHGATFEQLRASDWAIPSFAVTDDDYAIAGRTFHCKKVTYRQIDPISPRKTVDDELWLSSEVPVDGVVAVRESQHLDNMVSKLTEELVGFGSGSAATWGERPRGL